MSSSSETITFTFPAGAVAELPLISGELLDRMHELLERNTDGLLNQIETRELETLAQMTQFLQILEMSAARAAEP